jgi:vacuolar iron transporter family protein
MVRHGSRHHRETHRIGRTGWLRAMVLGSNDAIVSTASLMIGVAASGASRDAIVVSGVAGLVAGSMSMAVGEFVSVSSQRDAEKADIERERRELGEQPQAELRELARLYEKRGLDPALAEKVAEQLTAHDQLGAHLRDELGIDEATAARPFQAAWTSALSFAFFALVPIAALMIAPAAFRLVAIALASLLSLVSLGALGGYLGGASMRRAALRVTVGGALALATTAAIGRLVGVSVG